MEKIMSNVKELSDIFENRPWLTFLVLVTLGTMILFFLGCGSGSAPESKKAEKAAKSSGAMKSQAAMALLNHKEVKKSVAGQPIEIVPGFTQEELDAKHSAERQKFLAPGTELFPGITREQLDAKHATQRQRHYAPSTEVFRGITQEKLDAKHAAQRQRHFAPGTEVFRGITQEQLDAKMRQQVKPETREAFPASGGK
jgi:hypothetical protein